MATVTLRLETNIASVNKRLKQIPSKILVPSINSSLNKAASAGRTQSVRSLAKYMGLPQKQIRPSVSILRSNFRTLVAAIRLRGRPFNLIRFKAKETKSGVSSTAWGRRRQTKGAFIANKGRTVFVRTAGKMGSRKAGINQTVTKHNQKIKAVWGPGVAASAARKAVVEAAEAAINRAYRKNIFREIKRRSGRQLKTKPVRV